MNDISNLLSGSIREFEDGVNNVTVTPCSYLLGKNGLAYILLGDDATAISASLHTSTAQIQRAEGILNVADVLITTQADIFSLFETDSPVYVLEYKELKMCIIRSSDFNEVADTYHYMAEIIQNRNKGFILLNENLTNQMFFTNSIARWLEFGKNYDYKIYPAFLTPQNIEDTYFTVEIYETSYGAALKRTEEGLSQYLFDKIKITLTNGDLDYAQKFSYDLDNQATRYNYFGYNDFPKWSQSDFELQTGFGIKTNMQTMEIQINYTTHSKLEDVMKYIKEATINIQIAQ